jgi:transposase
MGNKGQVGYSSDVSDEEWAFVAPYLALCREDAAQRSHSLRAVFNALRWLVKTGAHWRMIPNDLPPWPVVYQQTRRWIRAGCFEIMVEDLRSLLREFVERKPQPTAMVVDKHTEAKRGFVLLPRRWVVERSFAWAARFRRLARDYERLSQTLAAFHYFAFACLMLARIFKMLN